MQLDLKSDDICECFLSELIQLAMVHNKGCSETLTFNKNFSSDIMVMIFEVTHLNKFLTIALKEAKKC